MNRIKNSLNNKNSFIGFITAGDPDLETTEKIIYKMIEAGTNLIEIGIPFSDPNAEGPTIQDSNIRALNNGVKIDNIFKMVKNIRANTNISLVFVGYVNSLFYYGYDKFFENCKKTGIDGIILSDLPVEESSEVKKISEKYEIELIPIVALTSENRVENIVKNSNGFVYLLAPTKDETNYEIKKMSEEIKKYANVPVAVDTYIKTPEQVKKILEISDCVIVGSEIVKLVEKYGKDAPNKVYEYIRDLRKYI